jgi:hypothetical protein
VPRPGSGVISRFVLLDHHRRWTVALLAVVVAAACSKSDDKPVNPGGASGSAGDPGAPKAYDNKPPPTSLGKLGATPDVLASSEDLSLLPVDSEVVMGVNFAQIRGSAAWKELIEPKLAGNASLIAKLNELKSTCGFDPMADVKSVAVGMKGLGGGTADGVLVLHGLDKAKTMECLGKKDALAKHDLDVNVDGDVALLKPAKGDPEDLAGVTFVNDTTAVVLVGPRAATKDGVVKAAAGKSPLKTSPTFIDMYNRLDTSQSLWLMVNGNSKLFERPKSLGIQALGMFGTLGTTDGLGVDLRLRVDTADNAGGIKNRFGGLAEQYMKKYVDKFTLSTEGQDLRLVLGATATNFEALKSLLGTDKKEK